jgi:hypothetical protein
MVEHTVQPKDYKIHALDPFLLEDKGRFYMGGHMLRSASNSIMYLGDFELIFGTALEQETVG